MVVNKISSVTVEVPFRSAGGIIRNAPVQFDVYQDGQVYKAIPQMNVSERMVANLPEELIFEWTDGKAVSPRGIREGNMHVIQAIASALKKENAIA